MILCYFENFALLAFVVAEVQMGVEVKVLVAPPCPNAALGIEAGCPLGATADAYGALGDAERVGGFLKGRMRGPLRRVWLKSASMFM